MVKLKERFEKLENGDYRIVFGKYNGNLLSDVIKYNYAYLDWIIWKSDFPDNIKEFLADRIQEFRQGDKL